MGRNEELVKLVQSGDIDSMGELWENNRRLVAKIARRYRGEPEDLIQTGYLGLYAAAVTYSPERGAAFSTFAVYHIRAAIRDAAGLHGKRDPLLDATSLDAPVFDDGEETLVELLPSAADEYPVEAEDFSRILHNAVDRLRDSKAREAVQAVYWEGAAVEDYAERERISGQAARERLYRAYDLLRRDASVVALALAEGYSMTRREFVDPEKAVLSQESLERRQQALLSRLGALAVAQ